MFLLGHFQKARPHLVFHLFFKLKEQELILLLDLVHYSQTHPPHLHLKVNVILDLILEVVVFDRFMLIFFQVVQFH